MNAETPEIEVFLIIRGGYRANDRIPYHGAPHSPAGFHDFQS
jgi:hypothetical protein